MATVVVLGTLDTKGEEHLFLAEEVRARGCDVVIVDAGIVGEAPARVDVSRHEVAAAAGSSTEILAEAGNRAVAVATMGRGAGEVLKRLRAERRLDAVVTLGGGSGTTLAGIAMNELPVGVPKLLVSTIAAGDMRPHVRGTDLTTMYAVLDIAGLNPITRRILRNAAGAVAGMAGIGREPETDGRPLVGATMFGVTTQGLQAARRRLEEHGYEVLVFHATGSGGESLEALLRAGFLTGVLDMTTTELADDLVGGVMSAGPKRLTAAAEEGIPQVVSVGALDMVNLGAPGSIAPEFRDRHLYSHATTMTLMRTTPQESAELGRRIADRLNVSKGPVTVFLPLRGISAMAVPGGEFHDPHADAALFSALRQNLRPQVQLVELDTHINDERFGTAMADRLIAMLAA
ncbi:Tm-1-like ATP-binding domain-containing protein [Streptomyces sp. AHA2]|uniref:Tm-1-like ATP-binding domain-containing protein n=1 Tax=Streptomyces sp. AHA2 TaxID=3064526 RepID=UPI002FE2E9B6